MHQQPNYSSGLKLRVAAHYFALEDFLFFNIIYNLCLFVHSLWEPVPCVLDCLCDLVFFLPLNVT